MQSHHDYSMAMGNCSETPCPVISVPWGESGPGGSCHADGDSEHAHHLHSVRDLAGVARQPCTTWVGGHLAPDPSCTPCTVVVPRSPPLTRSPRSPHLAPRCLQSPEGRRAGHTGREARCSAWAPSAPWAAVGRAGLSLDARIHQPAGAAAQAHVVGRHTFSRVDEFEGPVATSTMMLLPLCTRQVVSQGRGGAGSWGGRGDLPWSGRG